MSEAGISGFWTMGPKKGMYWKRISLRPRAGTEFGWWLTERTSFCTLGMPEAKKRTATPAATPNLAV